MSFLMLGDCLEEMKKIEDNSVDLVLADLPYGTTKCKWDSIIPLEPLWEQYNRVAKINAAMIFTASQPFTSTLVSSNLKNFKYNWVWEKSKATGYLNSKKMPMKAHEDVCVFYRKPPVYNPQMWQVQYFKTAESEGKVLHPTQKPLALMEYLVKTYSNEGDMVLDNVMGSGTTCVAAALHNRRFIGIEMDEGYFDIARDRIEKTQEFENEIKIL